MTIRGRKRTDEEAGPGVSSRFAYHWRLACRRIPSPELFPISSAAVSFLSLPLITALGNSVAELCGSSASAMSRKRDKEPLWGVSSYTPAQETTLRHLPNDSVVHNPIAI